MLTHDQIDDFVTTTIKKFKKFKWTDISMEFPQYVSARVMRDRLVTETGGHAINFQVKVRNTGTARPSGLYDQDQTGTEDLMVQGEVGWTKQTANFSYDIDEDLFQSDDITIVKMLKIRDHAMKSDMVKLNEEHLWGAPNSTSHKVPYGIPFWLQKDPSTDADGGFNGGNPSTHSGGRAGISSTDHPAWSNWTFGYTSVTTSDAIAKIRNAMWWTEFQAPVPHPQLGYANAPREIYTVIDNMNELAILAETRNENLGNDVMRYHNDIVVNRVPVKPSFYLSVNDNTDKPFYGINWEDIRPFAKKGRFMRRTKPMVAPLQHTVRNVHLDNWMNWCAYNLRTSWVGSKA